MRGKKGWVIGIGIVIVAALLVFALSPKAKFILGGAMVNLGYRFQDRLADYDFVHDESITPEEIWEELERQNDLAADVREKFPRSVRHPVVALVACMDARIDTSELVGDTRRYYYVVRTAGSVLAEAEQEMLELAVLNGVRLVLLTTHTDCAAEAAAADPEMEERFPAMTNLVDQREKSIEEFLARPLIRDAIAAGTLKVQRARIDTDTDRLMVPED
ncbi:MAG TPA: carbonic anhydrase [Polyangiales bacterium]|nr:carbonic anhydrase [Polyangiales bacterium]